MLTALGQLQVIWLLVLALLLGLLSEIGDSALRTYYETHLLTLLLTDQLRNHHLPSTWPDLHRF